MFFFFFFSSRRRHTRLTCDWSSDVCSSDLYVAAAKRLLLGTISTDAEAGPTEIAIIADDTADPEFVAADLIAQAEHDPLAACLLITTDPALADRVDKALEPQVAAARHRERVQAA